MAFSASPQAMRSGGSLAQDPGVAVRINKITKRYGEFTAVNELSLSIPRGTIFGLLGPNGAGKTTTIRMIMNIIMPDEGSIEVLGRSSTESVSQSIGYLPEERGLYRKMKVIDQLAFLGEIRGLSAAESRRRSNEWLDRIDLSAWKTKKVEDLSKGMQQKVQFIGCVIHDPEIIILDEPFSGLDPVNARVLKDLILEFRDRGKTLLFSTHIMEQAEKLCDSIALINRSRLLLNGTMAEIKKKFARNRFAINTTADASAIRGVSMVRDVVDRGNNNFEVELDPTATTPDFLRELTRSCDIESAVPHEPSLDEIFVDAVGGDLEHGEAA